MKSRLPILFVFILSFLACDLWALPKPFKDSLQLIQDDIILPERGTDFIFRRSYDSRTKFDGPLGMGWGFSFGASLIINKDSGTILLKDGDGLMMTYKRSDENTYLPEFGSDTLKILPDGKIERHIKNAGTQVFNGGLLEKILDLYGHEFLLVYQDEKLEKIFTPSLREMDVQTNEQGKITAVTGPEGQKVEYRYDEKNQLISVKDISGDLTLYHYDDQFHITAIEYPDGTKREIIYDNPSGKILELKGPGKIAVKYQYLDDQHSRASFNSGYQVDNQDDPAKRERVVSDNNGIKNIFKYDGKDFLIESQDAIGRVTTFQYDDLGRMILMSTPEGTKTEYVYDQDSGRLMKETVNGQAFKQYEYDKDGNVTGVQDALGLWTKYAYDKEGQLETLTDSKGRMTFYTYDSFGNISQLIHTGRGKSLSSYDDQGRLQEETDAFGNKISCQYDAKGNLIGKKFSEGEEFHYEFDKNGQLNKEIRRDGAYQKFLYDDSGRMIQKRNWEGGVLKFKYDENGQWVEETKVNGSKWLYTYNILGLLTQKADGAKNVTRFEYDKAGRLIKRVYPRGNFVELTYDVSDQVISKKTSDGQKVDWEYDANGCVTKLVSENGVTDRHYDAFGRLTSIEYRKSESEKLNQKIDFSYDARGNIFEISLGDHEKVNYMYDDLNRLSYAKDGDGHGVEFQYESGKLDFLERYSNGIVVEHHFDDHGCLKDVLAQRQNRAVFGYALTRDEHGRVIQKDFLSGISQKFEYDPMGRLKRFYQDPSVWEQYAYDSNGNILSIKRPHQKIQFTYDKQDHLLSEGPMNFKYDQNGNLIEKRWKDGAIAFHYDDENQLIKIDSSLGHSTEYVYDGEGRRIEIKTGNEGRAFLYDYQNLLMELDGQGNIKRVYAQGLGMDNPLFFKEAGKVFFYHQDPLDSVIVISNEQGEVENQYSYSPFGKILTKKENVSNAFQYTGREYDETFDVYFYRARFYDPALCRFLSQDLLKNQNLYAYVENDPINFNDPLGLATTWTPPQARVNAVADGMGFNRPTYTPEIPSPQGGTVYGAHETTILGNNPEIKVTRAALNAGEDQTRATIFHENVHELQRMRDPYKYGSIAEGSVEQAVVEREAHMRTYEYAVRNGLSKEAQEHSLEAFQRYGGTQAELESYMGRVGTAIPAEASAAEASALSRGVGAFGRAAGTAAAAYGAFEAGYTAGTVIENKYHPGEKMGISDWEYERLTRNGKIEKQEKEASDDLNDYVKNNVENGNLTLKPGVDPSKTQQMIDWNLNNKHHALDGITESPEERKIREQKEREEAYARYEVEQARINSERRKKEEELEKIIEQAQVFIGKAQGAQAKGAGIMAKVQSALQTSKNSESEVNGMVNKLQWISEKVTQLNRLAAQASSLATLIQGMNVTGGDAITAIYERAKDASQGACDIANNMQSSDNPQASAQLASQRAALAQGAATEAKGAGAKTLSTVAQAEANLAQLRSIKSQMDSIAGEAAGVKSQFSQAQGLLANANGAAASIASAEADIQAASAEIENSKSTVLGLLAPYTSFPQAQSLIGQVNALGANLQTESIQGVIQEVQATVARIEAKIAQGTSLVGTELPAFPVDIGALEEKVADLRATADTIDVFESKIAAEAGTAKDCASMAAQWVNSHPPAPPPGWSPTGDSVAGPGVPGKDAQNSSFQGATNQIGNNLTPPVQAPPSGGQGPSGPQTSPQQPASGSSGGSGNGQCTSGVGTPCSCGMSGCTRSPCNC